MELFTREPTSPAQTRPPAATALPRLDTAFSLAPGHYPSPIRERPPFGSAQQVSAEMASMSPNGAGPVLAGLHSRSVSPRTVTAPGQASDLPCKRVEFVLRPPYRARVPLRVDIFYHDTTDSIMTTVKDFFGLYPGPGISRGISLEYEDGYTLIARYENFQDKGTVYVRVIESPLESAYPEAPRPVQGLHHTNGYPFQGPQQQEALGLHNTSRASQLRSPSPNGGRGRRSASTAANPAAGKKGRSRSSKNRAQVNGESLGDSFNGYSSGDGAASSSGRAKEQLGNTDISVENIVEGGRRKRAPFESAELPLFAPPQMPTSTSNPSVSPARRIDPHRSPLPFIQTGQNPFSHPQPLPSPHSYTNGYAHSAMYNTPASGSRRQRESFGPAGQVITTSMVTPDGTVRSTVSDEDKDVALQLMYMSNGRASASTQDDTLSGRADAASSAGATSDAESCSDDEVPAARRQKLDAFGNHKNMASTTGSHFVTPSTDADGEDAGSSDVAEYDMMAPAERIIKPKANGLTGAKARPQPSHKPKSSKAAKPNAKKASVPAGPMTPASLNGSNGSRNQSIASNVAFHLVPGEDEQPDLSTKPRCQRCRKSKKGCDRQRPCGRCKDAGIPPEQCISEDEGNGRKGRYGRHMGVPIKRDDMPPPALNLLPAAPIAADGLMFAPLAVPSVADKNKKRKR